MPEVRRHVEALGIRFDEHRLMKKVGAPCESRSLVSGRLRQISRTAARIRRFVTSGFKLGRVERLLEVGPEHFGILEAHAEAE